MKEYLNKNNILPGLMAPRCVKTKEKWVKIDEVDFEFPEIDVEHLRQIFFRPYQIDQWQTHTEKHLDVNGNFTIQVSKEDDDIIRWEPT